MDELFRIVCDGTLREGEDVEQLKQRLAKLFHLSMQQTEKRFFAGNPVVVKRYLTKQDVHKYQQAFEKIGMECTVEREQPAPSQILVPEPSSVATPQKPEEQDLPTCPKCGYQAQSSDDLLITGHDGSGECPACGIVVKLYLQAQARKAEKAVEAPGEKTGDNVPRRPTLIQQVFNGIFFAAGLFVGSVTGWFIFWKLILPYFASWHR
jgi:hypothetical protein